MGMFFNKIDVWDSEDGEENIFSIDAKYRGFFLSGISGAGDIQGLWSIPNTYSVTLQKSLKDCDTGIKVYLLPIEVEYYSNNLNSTSVSASMPDFLTFKSEAPNALVDAVGTRFTLTISGNQLIVKDDHSTPMGSNDDGDYAFWAIKGIYAY